MVFNKTFGGPPRPNRSRLLKGKIPTSANEHRLNEQIRVPKVRLISETGEQVGIIDTREAIRMARDKNLDLMEVSPNANPPVCKICDYGKFKYEKKKKDHAAKKKQVVIKVKEIQLRPNTDVHDRDFKFKNAQRFLEEGDKVKITMMFRGREITQQENALVAMEQLAAELDPVSSVESRPKLEGRKMIMVLAPKKGATASKATKQPKTQSTSPTASTSKKKANDPAAKPAKTAKKVKA